MDTSIVDTMVRSSKAIRLVLDSGQVIEWTGPVWLEICVIASIAVCVAIAGILLKQGSR